MTNEAQVKELREALEALTEWCCTHTSPRDSNSPHELLIRARLILEYTNNPPAVQYSDNSRIPTWHPIY